MTLTASSGLSRQNFRTLSYNDRLFESYLRVDDHDEFDELDGLEFFDGLDFFDGFDSQRPLAPHGLVR